MASHAGNYRQCKQYVIVIDGRPGIAVAETQRMFLVQLGADGPHEKHRKNKCEIVTESEWDKQREKLG